MSESRTLPDVHARAQSARAHRTRRASARRVPHAAQLAQAPSIGGPEALLLPLLPELIDFLPEPFLQSRVLGALHRREKAREIALLPREEVETLLLHVHQLVEHPRHLVLICVRVAQHLGANLLARRAVPLIECASLALVPPVDVHELSHLIVA